MVYVYVFMCVYAYVCGVCVHIYQCVPYDERKEVNVMFLPQSICALDLEIRYHSELKQRLS